MFEDFLNKDYWKMERKIATIRELINRFMQLSNITDIDAISERVERLDDRVQNLGGWINVERRPPDEPRPPEEGGEETVLLPDLIVSEITSSEETNVIAFTIIVKNQGTADSDACKLDINIPGSYENKVTLNIPALTVGKTTSVHHQYSFDASSIESKVTRTIIATVDSTHIITESNEGNNTKLLTFESLPQTTGVIAHLHNPEGREIGSILGGSAISISPSFLGIVEPVNDATHGVAQIVSPGQQTISATFNGITLEKEINIQVGQTYELFFIFPRKDGKQVTYALEQSTSVEATDDELRALTTPTNPSVIHTKWGAVNLRTNSLSEVACKIIIGLFVPINSVTGSMFCSTNRTANQNSYSISNTVSISVTISISWMFIKFISSSEVIANGTPLPQLTTKLQLLPSTADEINWYIQTVTYDYYPNISLKDINNNYYQVIEGTPSLNQTKYKTTAFPCKIEMHSDYSMGSVGGANNSGSESVFQDTYTRNFSNSRSGSASWITSTVPYDIEGIAI